MKKLYFLAIILTFGIISAQQPQDYQYIVVPNSFSGFKPNEYSLNNQLKILLKQKGYNPIGEDNSYWPQEIKLNPCRALTANLIDHSTFLKNGLKLSFTDCNNTLVGSWESFSNIRDYKNGFSDALQKIVEQISNSQSNDELVNPTSNQITIVTKETQPHPYAYMLPEDRRMPKQITTTVIEEEKINFQDSEFIIKALENGEIIIINLKKKKIFAHFYPAKKTGIYHVKISSATGLEYYTIGYKNNAGQLSYEQTNDYQSWNLVEIDQPNSMVQ